MYIKQPRLRIYNNLIGLYDSSDKYKYSKIKFSIINHIKLYNSVIKLTNKNLSPILFQEFATTQRFNLFNNNKINFLKKFFLTLRNNFMYLYLEFLINSNLLINKLIKKVHVSFTTINSILSITTFNFYTNFLNELLDYRNKIYKMKINFNWKGKNLFLGNFLFYYYLS